MKILKNLYPIAIIVFAIVLVLAGCKKEVEKTIEFKNPSVDISKLLDCNVRLENNVLFFENIIDFENAIISIQSDEIKTKLKESGFISFYNNISINEKKEYSKNEDLMILLNSQGVININKLYCKINFNKKIVEIYSSASLNDSENLKTLSFDDNISSYIENYNNLNNSEDERGLFCKETNRSSSELHVFTTFTSPNQNNVSSLYQVEGVIFYSNSGVYNTMKWEMALSVWINGTWTRLTSLDPIFYPKNGCTMYMNRWVGGLDQTCKPCGYYKDITDESKGSSGYASERYYYSTYGVNYYKYYFQVGCMVNGVMYKTNLGLFESVKPSNRSCDII